MLVTEAQTDPFPRDAVAGTVTVTVSWFSPIGNVLPQLGDISPMNHDDVRPVNAIGDDKDAPT